MTLSLKIGRGMGKICFRKVCLIISNNFNQEQISLKTKSKSLKQQLRGKISQNSNMTSYIENEA